MRGGGGGRGNEDGRGRIKERKEGGRSRKEETKVEQDVGKGAEMRGVVE